MTGMLAASMELMAQIGFRFARLGGEEPEERCGDARILGEMGPGVVPMNRATTSCAAQRP